MNKLVRIHHLKSDEVEIEMYADFDFGYKDVLYCIKVNGTTYGKVIYYYISACSIFLELAESWGWSEEDCERS